MSSLLVRILPKAGDVLVDRYELIEEVGQGGFGVVFRAHQRGLGEDVCVKVLKPAVTTDESLRARFRREVKLAKGLRHPNTIRLLDVAETETGLPFYVMEFLRGASLDETLANGPLSAKRVRKITTQMLLSLSEAHAQGIVHRDLKPANIMLCDIIGAVDMVKVLDFGIAKALGTNQAAGPGMITKTNVMVGTPNYMSPEQALAEKDIDHRSDLYTVGLIMAECLTGLPVVSGDSILRVLSAHASARPLAFDASVMNSPLWPVIERCTAKERRDRYQSAQEMVDALEELPSLSNTAPAVRDSERLFAATRSSVSPSPAPSRELAFQPTMATPIDRPLPLLEPETFTTTETPVPKGVPQWVFYSAALVLLAAAATLMIVASGNNGTTTDSNPDGLSGVGASAGVAEASGAEAEGDEVQGEAAGDSELIGSESEVQVATAQRALGSGDGAPSLAAVVTPVDPQLLASHAIATERIGAALPRRHALVFNGLEDVRVLHDGDELGVTPFDLVTLELRHELTVQLERDGYRSASLTFSLADDSVEVDLRRRRREHSPEDDDEDDGSETTETGTNDNSPFGQAPIDTSGH